MRTQKLGRKGKGGLCWKKRFRWKATSCLWNYIITLGFFFFNFCNFIQLHHCAFNVFNVL